MGNSLASSSSPYLIQHADNPVDWHEWGAEALARARKRDDPVLLSIGYAACHWCHVMAHESFEDPETAALMNRLYVNVKVDREQRPDLDRIYQLAHQVMNRRGGGWPLTVFLDPHTHLPFFIGTYFPKSPRHGLPDFRTVLERVAEWYRNEPEARGKLNDAMAEFFASTGPGGEPAGGGIDGSALDRAQVLLEREFDPRHGGFSPAPKFPHPGQLAFLLHRDDPRAQHMAGFTLERMSCGGLFDQVGGGWYRYSVDARWEIPHFEKMLCDNGSLLACATRCWLKTGERVHERAARMTADWALREMQHADGGFHSSLDADSEGHEGRFYVWDADTLRETLDDDEWRAAAHAWGLDLPPNFEGAWHLHGVSAPRSDAEWTILERARMKLFDVRESRVRPAVDDKVLAGWNGLMIASLSEAARAFDRPDWREAASRAADFVRTRMWRDGRLCVSWRDDTVLPMAFLDDHAYLLEGLLELMQTRFRKVDLEFAMRIADTLLERFRDTENGGFYFTPDGHEPLVQRPKSFIDDATPNGNGVAALALQRLGHLIGEPRYLDAAADTLRAACPTLGEYPHAHAAILLALDEHLQPPAVDIIRAGKADLASLGPHDPSHRGIEFKIPADLDGLPGQLSKQTLLDGEPTRYRCTGDRCEAPVKVAV